MAASGWKAKLGKGSKFHFEVSFLPADGQTIRPDSDCGADSEQHLVLIADNNAVNLKMLNVFLQDGESLQ
jgi:hypothetical protein